MLRGLNKMLIEETIVIDNRELLRHYSDNNKFIIQVDTGIKYAEAVDILNTTHTYRESDESIPIIDKNEREG